MKPLLRGHFHQAMFFIALGAFIPLIIQSQTFEQKISLSIYALCTLLMFGISSIYHRVNWTPDKRQFWRKLDHASIYLMIAGTSTPVAILALSNHSGNKVLLTVWIVALAGTLQSIFFVNIPKWISAVFYLLAGYAILPYFSELIAHMGVANIWLIILGGVAYSLGAACYGFKWPSFNPKVFGYHEVFHILVNIGAIFHFIAISRLIA